MAEKTGNTEEIIEAEVVADSTSASSKKTWISWLLIIVLFIGCGSLFWLYIEQQKQLSELTSELSEVSRVANDDSQIEAKIAKQAKQTEAAVAALDEQRDALTQDMKKLAESLQLSNAEIQRQWALAEVNGLLNTANHQLLLAGNVKAALKAIELADKRVEELDDYSLHPLRALLASEKMALKELADTDIEGMVLQLQTAINQVDQLQVVSGPAVAQINETEVVQPSSEPSWKQAVNGIWQEIRSLVVIRHKQDGSAAVLLPEQRYFLYQNLMLKLETARFALLRYDVSLFKDSLSSATTWLNDYFVGNERDAMISTLKAIQQVEVTQALPDISASSSWLKEQGFAE
jgi:uroporphyrin-3 C-methyltransferase